jgi:hypothetical protein
MLVMNLVRIANGIVFSRRGDGCIPNVFQPRRSVRYEYHHYIGR